MPNRWEVNGKFHELPAKEQIRLCRRFEEHARMLAEHAHPALQPRYLEIAEQWALLAREIAEKVPKSHL